MGSDAEAHLVYGYYLGGPDAGWKIQGVDRFEQLDVDWHTTDDFLADIKRKLREMAGFTETHGPNPNRCWDMCAAEKRLKVAVRFTGAESGMDYTLYAVGSHHNVEWGAKPVNPVIPEDADQHLAEAIAYLGITPTQPEPSWVLGALYF